MCNYDIIVLKTGLTPNRKAAARKGMASGTGTPHSAETGSLSVGDESLEGCSSFMEASSVYLCLVQSEAKLMQEIIPQSHHPHVLDSLIKQPMDFFMSKGETLFQQARKNVLHNDYSVVLSCLGLLRHIKKLLPEYRLVLQVRNSGPCRYYVYQTLWLHSGFRV